MPIRPPQHRPHNRPTDTVSEPRLTSADRGYDRRWRRLRAAVLAERPLCEICHAAGRLTPARDLHHIQPLSERPDLRLDTANLQPLCTNCHSRHTANESRTRQQGRG